VSTTTIRVSTKTRNILREMAVRIGLSMQEIVEQAIENYRRQHLFTTANAAYAALRADSKAWQAYQAEQAEWDVTLADGLEEV
jgi:predicted transcriptional regulator